MNNHILSDFLSGRTWKMERKIEKICGNGYMNTAATILKCFVISVLIVLVVVLTLQSFGIIGVPMKEINENGKVILYFKSISEAGDAPSTLYNPIDFLEIIIGVLTVIATIYTCLQIYLMKDINRMEMSHNIYKDNQEYRNSADEARKNLKALYDKVNELGITVKTERESYEKNEESRFHALILEKEYEPLRSFAYHYEYIGYLTLRDKLNFDVAFDTITFYNWLIVSDEAAKIIEIGRQFTPDFWNGSEYLYRSYEVRRKYNKYKGYDAKQKGNTKDGKKALKGDFDTACDNWKKKYLEIS